MKRIILLYTIYFTTFFTLFIGGQTAIERFFPELDHLYALLIAGALTILLTPTVRKTDVEQGSRYQLKWLFRKEPLMK